MPDPVFAKIDASTSGQTQIVASVTAKKIVVIGYVIVAGGTVNVKFQDHNTDITGAIPLIANTGVATMGGMPHFATTVGQELNINLSGNVQVSGHLTYLLEDF